MQSTPILFQDEKVIFECAAQRSQIYASAVLSIFSSFGLIFPIDIVWLFIIVSTYQHQHNPSQTIHQLITMIIVNIAIIIFYMLTSFFRNSIIIPNCRYILTNQRCIFQLGTGFKGLQKKSIPYARVSDINIIQGFIQSFFGTTNIFIEEQPNGETSLLIGLSAEDADKVMSIISSNVSKKT